MSETELQELARRMMCKACAELHSDILLRDIQEMLSAARAEWERERPARPESKELLLRIDKAIHRITHGEGLMRVPADKTDPDLVLSECESYIESADTQLSAATERAKLNMVLGWSAALKKAAAECRIVDKSPVECVEPSTAEWCAQRIEMLLKNSDLTPVAQQTEREGRLREIIQKYHQHPRERKNWDAADEVYEEVALELEALLAAQLQAPVCVVCKSNPCVGSCSVQSYPELQAPTAPCTCKAFPELYDSMCPSHGVRAQASGGTE